MLTVFDLQVRRGIAAVFTLSGVRPASWVIISVLLSLAQTALSTIPVVAMVPLLQLFTGDAEGSPAVRVVSDAIGTTDPRVLVPVFALCIAAIFLLCSGLSVLVTWALVGRTIRLGAEANAELLRRYVSDSYENHRARSNAEIYRNIGLVVPASTTLSNVLTVCTSALTLLALCAVLLIASPLATVLTVVVFGSVMALAQRALRRAQKRAGEEIAEASLQSWYSLLPLVDGFREVRLSSRADGFAGAYRGAQLRAMRANRVLAALGSIPAAVSQVAFALAVAGIAAILFSTGTAANAVTVLGLFAAAAMRALPTLNLLFSMVGAVRSGQKNLEILADAVEELSGARADARERSSGLEFSGDLVFDAVTFAYADAPEPVVRDVDLVIQEHATTAIAGTSGAGKSTLIDIALGLLAPTSGTVTCGGRSVFDDLAGWYAGIGVVPQDVFLLNDTIEANIAFGVPSAEVDPDRVRDALRFAQLLPLIDSLPDGTRTVVGERGTRLSGGQRQRLGLARAMYGRPRLLLLDEATSALDNETEAEITHALNALHGEVTIIVVAHRLSTVRSADKLVFLQDGRIAGAGTFAEVTDSVPEFARLVELGKI